MKVYENGVLQKSLSRDFEFSPKRKGISINLKVNIATYAFIPYGNRGATGYIAIETLG